MAPPQGPLPMISRERRNLSPPAEVCGVAGLIGLFFTFLAISWRKWPDPLIDFGRELYLPWRLSHGAVLYREVDHFFGPLSQYFDAALFTIFGPSLMHLAAANLIIFVGILGMTYHLIRRAWGTGAALVALALYIAVFGFSQLGEHGNYNYVTPYAEETTHGIFVCLALVVVLVRWVENGTPAGSFLIGWLLGCTFLLKPEFILAAGVVILAAVLAKHRLFAPVSPRALGVMACGAVLPTVGFTLYFATVMPWGAAVGAACRGWLNAVTTTRYVDYPMELSFLGLDRPAENLREEILATLYSGAILAAMAGGAWLADRPSRRWLYLLGVGLGSAAMVWLAAHGVHWLEAGLCLPGLMLIYVGGCAASLFGGKQDAGDRQAQLARWLFSLLALALLARMFLHARIHQYGYYQAALAAITVPAILIGELPGRLGFGRRGAGAMAAGTIALLLTGAVVLCSWSAFFLGEKTVPVGTGGDLFYASRYDRTGELVDAVSGALREGPRDQTLLVLPEGVMINYLARLPNSIAPLFYFEMGTTGGREKLILDDLQRRPPDHVVVISRTLFEYGITRYGAERGEGRDLIDWVTNNYDVEEKQGGNPLDCYQLGVVVLTRKPGLP